MQKPAEGNFRGHAFMQLGVSLDPGVDLGLGQALDGLLGVGGLGAAAAVHEVEAVGGLVEGLLIAGGITKSAHSVLLHHGGGLGVVFLLANHLFHCVFLLSPLYPFTGQPGVSSIHGVRRQLLLTRIHRVTVYRIFHPVTMGETEKISALLLIFWVICIVYRAKNCTIRNETSILFQVFQ